MSLCHCKVLQIPGRAADGARRLRPRRGGAIFMLLAFALTPNLCSADTITDVTGSNSVTLGTGSQLTIDFGTWTYAANNSGYSPDPTSLLFEAYGPTITGALASVPGSSAQYYSGYDFTGYLESADGAVIAPLTDPNAVRVGSGSGTVLVTPGLYNSPAGTEQVSMLSASVTLSQTIADSLFGPDAAKPWLSDARIVLINTGQALTLGLGDNYSLKSALQEANLAGAGPATTSGMTTSVQLDVPDARGLGAADTPVPEPSAIYLFAAGLTVMLVFMSRRIRRRG